MAATGGSSKNINCGLLFIRLALGCFFIFVHGVPKLLGGPPLWKQTGGSLGVLGIHFAPAFWGFMAAFAESAGGLMVALGLFFRPSCALIIFTLAVAAIHHFAVGDGIGKAAHAIEDGIVFIGLFITGPGRYSINKR